MLKTLIAFVLSRLSHLRSEIRRSAFRAVGRALPANRQSAIGNRQSAWPQPGRLFPDALMMPAQVTKSPHVNPLYAPWPPGVDSRVILDGPRGMLVQVREGGQLSDMFRLRLALRAASRSKGICHAN